MKIMNRDFFTKDPSVRRYLKIFNSFLNQYLHRFNNTIFQGQEILLKALHYSLFSGGKRFRPLLIFSTAEILSIKNFLVLPWAAAVEMIHTASLIHDDLPCMDNSFSRRNRASCHRRFSEDMALLAGDCLWIEAFRMIAEQKEWVRILSSAGGFWGLMGGQALDLYKPVQSRMTAKTIKEYYQQMHSMKTGALISAGIQGVTALIKKENLKTKNLKEIGWILGRAFQLSDDLQDLKKNEPSNFARVLGAKTAEKQLKVLSHKALQLAKEAGFADSLLNRLIIFNQNRCEVSHSVV